MGQIGVVDDGGKGQPYMEKLSRLSGLPVWMTSAEDTVAAELKGKVPGLLAMKLQAKYFDLPEQGGPRAAGPVVGRQPNDGPTPPKARPLFG